ncbi:MAG: hypothetical protein NTW60_01405, partial [Candidatus Wolfebacteria bacterium]|nr:hypothetical protein [Candidatus Wolfebacteria bacterium]
MDKKKIRQSIKELPINFSIAGLALLLGLGERGAMAVSEILAGPQRGGLAKGLKRISDMRDFWDYYDELKKLNEPSARTILWRLQKKGLVKKHEQNYELTVLGLNILGSLKESKSLKEVWDGKWRIVMFDIPEKKRSARSWIRWELLSLEYKPLQRSVFVGKKPLAEDFYEEILNRHLNDCV